MNKNQKKVCRALYKPNCYILVSATRRDPKETFGEFQVTAHMSFLYDAGKVAAEWEPQYGPIQIWRKCDKDSDGAQEHYFYDFQNSAPGSWSQLAVSNMELPQAFVSGDYDYIFNVLKDWATNR
jgi:hypothetical protein